LNGHGRIRRCVDGSLNMPPEFSAGFHAGDTRVKYGDHQPQGRRRLHQLESLLLRSNGRFMYDSGDTILNFSELGMVSPELWRRVKDGGEFVERDGRARLSLWRWIQTAILRILCGKE